MKKHIIGLTYKDLHAIKHALDKALIYKKDVAKYCALMPCNEIQLKQDIEYETNLLERITERINEIKDKYCIGD